MSKYPDWMVNAIADAIKNKGLSRFTAHDIADRVRRTPTYLRKSADFAEHSDEMFDLLDRELETAINWVISRQRYVIHTTLNGRKRTFSTPMYPSYRYGGDRYRQCIFGMTRNEAQRTEMNKQQNAEKVNRQLAFWRFITAALKGQETIGDLNLDELLQQFLTQEAGA